MHTLGLFTHVCMCLDLQVLLTSLLHLKLDGNNMPHLAVPPLLKTSNGQDQSTNWAKRWNRDKKREVGWRARAVKQRIKI